ncbi:unnamed protein product [Fraxinus pennsylvanica]|uniref:Uncharacterized protein n=1 Tax=Fraxinus pennsylvanica TaxID=56036 RepID=A0AAD2DH00_9LAMI|nr:unnamed protein product [Fraxinus pennsylvanica]
MGFADIRRLLRMDMTMKVISFSQLGPRAICVLSANAEAPTCDTRKGGIVRKASDEKSAKTEFDALAKAERMLMMIEKNLHDAEAEKKHFENVMSNQVLSYLNNAEAEYREFEHKCKENRRKASIICPESEIEALGGCSESNPEQLSAQLSRMNQRLQRESQRFPESIEDLRMLNQKRSVKS